MKEGMEEKLTNLRIFKEFKENLKSGGVGYEMVIGVR